MSTIFAPATAPGRAGVAVLRISGPGASEVCRLFGTPLPSPRQAHLALLTHPDSGDVIDEALLLWFPGPASFTGEDVLELHLHSSMAVMQEITSLLGAQEGFRLAEPGEFSRRAFYNHKMDLTQTEAIADLIDAETISQQRQAIRQMQGGLSDFCEKLRQQIIRLRAYMEAYLDFPDEEIPDDLPRQIDRDTGPIIATLKTILADQQSGERIRQGIHIAIIGIPNAGKSTLLNALARRDVAITSEEAGTTRDILEVHLDIGGYAVILSDTAGIRDGADSVEAEGIRRARQQAEQADIRLALLDGTSSLASQEDILSLIRPDDVLVINKSDLKTQDIVLETSLPSPCYLSAKTQNGLERLISSLKARMERMVSGGEEAIITRARHRQYFEETLTALQQSVPLTELELKGEQLRLASDALGKIVGIIHIEDILDEIFGSFCIGK